MKLLLMAMFFAAAASAGAMLLAEYLDTSFHSVGDLRKFTSVPVLATIPYLTGPTNFLSQALRVAVSVAAVICVCVLLVAVARYTAHENTQLVWVLSGPQL
jgi:hypothetical protein